jgi:hypothetical protein
MYLKHSQVSTDILVVEPPFQGASLLLDGKLQRFSTAKEGYDGLRELLRMNNYNSIGSPKREN